MIFNLTLNDIIMAAVLSLLFTWIILNISKVVKIVIDNPTEFDYPTKDFDKIEKRCYSLFPRDVIQFEGETYKRGMNISITTHSKKKFEGMFMGLNSENSICVLTTKYIVAYKLDGIEEIIRIRED